MNIDEYDLTTTDLAAEFKVSPKTIRRRAAEIGIGVDLGGRAGFRYNAEDRRRLIESLRPEAPVARRRRAS